MIISLTRLRVRAWRFLPPFLWYSLLSAWQARRAVGNLGAWLLRDSNRVFWTRTAWRDEESVRKFMSTGPHGRAMRRLFRWCDEAAVARWEEDAAGEPDWQEMHRMLLARGRPSRVARPSEAQQRFAYPPPAPGQARDGGR